MSTLIKHAGVWKEPEMMYVKDGGIWKEVGGGLPKAPGPIVGEPFGGGYVVNGFYYEFVGGNEVIVSGGPGEYLYIVADKLSEASLQWKTSSTTSSGTTSATDGWANTNAMNNASHPAAKYCRDYRGGGFDDWYLPAKEELHTVWLNLWPASRTAPASFRAGGPQALDIGDYYFSSTQVLGSNVSTLQVSDGTFRNLGKTTPQLVRPVRKIKL